MEQVKKFPQFDLDTGNSVRDSSVSQGGNKEGDRSTAFPTASDVATPEHVNSVWNSSVKSMNDRDKFPSPSGRDYNKTLGS